MAYAGIIGKDNIQKIVNELKESKTEYYSTLVPKEKSEYFVIKAVHTKGEIITPAVHKKSQDIYIITSGKSLFTFKGELVDPYADDLEKDYETIRGKEIANGETLEIKEGDIISIPPNTPHSIDARNSEITFIIIKIDDVI
jgi:mannose-6-phosphate isomerase-like protein (cupin superfamily)